jgi:hypothetical protein
MPLSIYCYVICFVGEKQQMKQADLIIGPKRCKNPIYGIMGDADRCNSNKCQ